MFRKSLFYMNFVAKLKAAVFQTFEYVGGLGHIKNPPFERVLVLAEKEGFEPPEGSSPSTVFKTVPFNRSGISPWAKIETRQILPSRIGFILKINFGVLFGYLFYFKFAFAKKGVVVYARVDFITNQQHKGVDVEPNH